MMDSKLTTFINVAKLKSYTRAAEMLNITQPAVSQHIKQLEEYYKVKLIKKKGRQISLTEEGELLLKNAKEFETNSLLLKRKLKNKSAVIKRYNIGVFSIATEFIENEDENVTKQDCEIKAFKRLAPKLKAKYPRLPISILADSLYACELITQLTDILRQLYEKGVDKIRDLEKSIKEISSSLLESFRTRFLTDYEDILNLEKSIQIRFL